MLPFIVIGLTTGAIYALAALGLVLTYRITGIFNFAHAALATTAAYVFYALYVLDRWPWPLAASVAICGVGPAMGLLLELLARRLERTTLVLRVAATVGMLLVIESAVTLIYGTQTVRTVPTFLGTGNFRIGGANVQVAQLVTVLFVVAVTACLTGFLRLSRPGLAMRALVDDPRLLDVAGTSPTATRRMAWVIGTTLAAASGVLLAPVLPLDPVELTLLLASAFGAAAIGRFTSLPITFAGGLAIGVLAALCSKWFTGGLLSGLPSSLPFVALLVIVLASPGRGLADRASSALSAGPTPWRAPVLVQIVAAAVFGVVLLLVPAFAGVHLTDYTTFLATAIVFMSLGLLVRAAGQIPLAQIAVTAVGASAFSHLAIGAGIPWLIALALSGLIAVPIGALLAVPALRLNGLFVALGSFGFAILLQDNFYSQPFMFGASGAGIQDPRPRLPWLAVGSDKRFYYVVMVIAGFAALLAILLDRGRLGRLARGVAASPTAVATSGASRNVTLLAVFGIAAFLAAVGGALAGAGQGTVLATSYQPTLSLAYFAAIVIVPGRAPWDAIIAAAAVVLVPSYLPGFQLTTVVQLLFGASAIAYAVLPGQARTVPLRVRRAIDGAVATVRGRVAGGSHDPVGASEGPPRPVSQRALRVEGVSVHYGRRTALKGVSLRVEPGRITGLIGPNGAGKTTMMDVCSGLSHAGEGRVWLADRELTRRGPPARARAGVGRTFQTAILFDGLTVRANVEASVEAGLAGANPLHHVAGRAGDSRAIRRATNSALELCELTSHSEVSVWELSASQRRLVELARALARPLHTLLLDEPSAGLDASETERLGRVLKRVVADRGVGILLVEHDVSFVFAMCQWLYVLDLGDLIFEGTAAEAATSQAVKRAYLGDEEQWRGAGGAAVDVPG